MITSLSQLRTAPRRHLSWSVPRGGTYNYVVIGSILLHTPPGNHQGSWASIPAGGMALSDSLDGVPKTGNMPAGAWGMITKIRSNFNGDLYDLLWSTETFTWTSNGTVRSVTSELDPGRLITDRQYKDVEFVLAPVASSLSLGTTRITPTLVMEDDSVVSSTQLIWPTRSCGGLGDPIILASIGTAGLLPIKKVTSFIEGTSIAYQYRLMQVRKVCSFLGGSPAMEPTIAQQEGYQQRHPRTMSGERLGWPVFAPNSCLVPSVGANGNSTEQLRELSLDIEYAIG